MLDIAKEIVVNMLVVQTRMLSSYTQASDFSSKTLAEDRAAAVKFLQI